ncbi:SAICAR synthase-like protein [Suillus hirtellus]|nr:SAICAR synthase-like protein [Suillus hirtellus]
MDHTHAQIHIVEVTRDTVHLHPPKPLPSIPREDTIGPPPPSPPASVDESPDNLSSLFPVRLSKSDPLPKGIETDIDVELDSATINSHRTHDRLHRASTETKLSARIPRVSQTSSYAQSTSTSKTPQPDGLLHPPARPVRRNTTGSARRPHPPPSTYVATGELEDDIQIQAEQIRRERKRKQAAEVAAAAVVEVAQKEDERPLVGNLIGEDHANYVLMYNMLTGIRIAVSRCQAKIKRPLTEQDFTARHKYSFDIVGNELTPSARYDFKFKDYAPWVFRELREDHFSLDPADYLLSLTSKYILSELTSPGKSGSFFYFSRDYRFIIKTIRHAEHKFLLRVLPQYWEHVKANPHTLLSRFYGLHRVKLPRGQKIHFVIMNNLFPPHKDIHESYDLKGSTIGRIVPPAKLEQNPRAVQKDLNWIDSNRVLELGPEKRALLTEQLRRDSEMLRDLGVMDYSLLVGLHWGNRGNRENVRGSTLRVFEPSVPPIRRKTTQTKDGRSPEAIAMRRIMRASDPHHLGTTLDLPDSPPSSMQTVAPSTPTHSQRTRPRSGSKGTSNANVGVNGNGNGITQQAHLTFQTPPHSSHPLHQSQPPQPPYPQHQTPSNAPSQQPHPTQDRDHFLFYQDEGGLQATDESNEEMDVIYYLGIIDILTPYGGLKKCEHFWKGLSADRHKISPVPPSEYADRFFGFMKAIMRGGEGGSRFKAE